MRKHSIQQSFVPAALTAEGGQLAFTLPRGFSGYARVKFVSGTATDSMQGIWVPVTETEQVPQNKNRLNATNASLHWLAGEEKLWILPPEQMALLVVGVGTLNGAFVVVDVNGTVSEQPT